jgi:hypothetical protein
MADNRRSHPSGRPVRKENRRSWADGYRVEYGFRTPKLNPPAVPRIQGATDIHAIGFLNWEIRQAQYELEMKGRK